MIKNLHDLIKTSESFSIPEDRIEAEEKGRQEFLSKFPLESILDLKIDDFCIGTNENSFCYWLEFRNILFGIGGGNASKFGIYKSKDGNYYENAGTKKISLQSDALEENFNLLKKGVIQGLSFVEKDEIDNVLTIQTHVWNMVLLKIFCIYYPQKFLTIGDPEVLIECARTIGVSGIELKNENSIIINYLCRKKLNETFEFAKWNYARLGIFIWQTFKVASKRDYYLIGSKYGDKADKDMFPQMLSRSVVATDFALNLDLSDLFNENHSVIKEYLQSHDENNNSITALKHFLSLRPGDLVAVKGSGSPKGKEGYLSIVGIAEVIEKNGKVYEYDPNHLGHIVNVKFLNAPVFWEFPIGGYGRTMHKLSNNEHIKIIFNSNMEMNYYDELRKFLAQAETDDLRTAHYLNKYLELEVKVGFGQGNKSKIPWVAFLNEIDTVQRGIYPVYLYYIERKLLILAFGISEAYPSNRNWGLSNGKTIEKYFRENKLGKPERYGSSYVYKSYNIDKGIEKNEVNYDLSNLIKIYKSQKELKILDDFQYLKFKTEAANSGLYFSIKVDLRFATSLITKQFVVLTGLSGSGKTKLAQVFAKWICKDKSQYKLIPVGADWTNREPLLGYPNALKNGEYILPENGVLELILAAKENLNKPHFLILDEMNLSHVERYFADFLSAMESGEVIALHPESEEWKNCKIPSNVTLPKNLFVVGTVNIDETTYMFSPKVLDRASVIEFRVSEMEMAKYLEDIKPLDLDKIDGLGAEMAESFVELARNKALLPKDPEILRSTLILFFNELKRTGAEFGYRTASEIYRFAAVANELDPTWEMDAIVDCAIMQKLLPKVHGSRSKLNPVLTSLAKLCIKDGTTDFFEKDDEFRKAYFIAEDKITDDNKKKIIYPLSFEKIARMHKNAIDNGFTSYAEA